MTFDPIEMVLTAAFLFGGGWLGATFSQAAKIRTLRTKLIASKNRAERFAREPASQAKTKYQTLERKFWELHDLIGRLLEQRDVWVQMWRTQAAEHLQGQSLFEHKVITLRQNLIRTLQALNHVRKELAEAKGEDFQPVRQPRDLAPLAPPVGGAEDYYRSMRELLARAPADFDPYLERDRITVESGLGKGKMFRRVPMLARAEKVSEDRRVKTPGGEVVAPAGSWYVVCDGVGQVVDDGVFQRTYRAEPPGLGGDDQEEVLVTVLDSPEPV